jgi:hypothetical protein
VGPEPCAELRKHDVTTKIDHAVRQRWQPQVRKRRQKQAATTGGITVETRAPQGRGSRATGLSDVTLNDIDYLDFDY